MLSRQSGEFLRKSIPHVLPLALGEFSHEIKHPAASSGVLTALLQSAGLQPAFAPRGRGLKPAEIKHIVLLLCKLHSVLLSVFEMIFGVKNEVLPKS